MYTDHLALCCLLLSPDDHSQTHQPLLVQVLQGKLDAAAQKLQDTQSQLSTERERAEAAQERGRVLDRQLAEHQQDSERLLKKKEDLEAELAAQACNVHHCVWSSY